MRTIRFKLAFLLFAAAAPLAHAQDTIFRDGRLRPAGMTEKEWNAKKTKLRLEINHYKANLEQHRDGATGFEGTWRIKGTTTSTRGASSPRIAEYAGEVTIETSEDGTVSVAGKLGPIGKKPNSWAGKGKLSDDGQRIETEYKGARRLFGTGTATYTLQGDGTLQISFSTADDASVAIRGQAQALRAMKLDRAEIEAKLFALNTELQQLRYPRAKPLSYRARSRKFKLKFTPNVEYDPNGVEQEVVELLGTAKKTIDICVFEFSLMSCAKALVAAKNRGVRVRMVYDNREEDKEAIHYIKKHGIDAKSDGRSARMHNKFIVIDGSVTWTGSTNLASGGIYIADNHALTFTNAKVAQIYTTEFEEMFLHNQYGPTSPQNTDHSWVEIDRYTSVQVYFGPEDGVMNRVIEIVKTAKKSIRFIAFAFTAEGLFQAMKERMADGVKVEGIFESRHAGWKDIKIGPLHALGAKVRYDSNPNALHHKVIIVDGKYVISGSFNFTDTADKVNDENLLVIKSRPAARTFNRELARLMAITNPDDPRIATSGMPTTGDGLTGAVNGTTGDDEPREDD